MTWGMLTDATFNGELGELTIEAAPGPNIRIQVEALDVTVSASDHVRGYRHLRAGLWGESLGKRIDVAEVGALNDTHPV
jgi:hypothetical protein